MKTKWKLFLALFLALSVQTIFAQEKTISGTITDNNGLPLPGASVIIKSTTSGTSSDFDGNYSIKANIGSTLIFSFIGYTSQEITVSNSTIINTVLQESTQSLDEVLIVGYGTATKQSFTGTVKTIKSENLEIKSVSNVSQALAGEAAGVQVINTSGQPGTSATIRIRGFGSVNGNRSPLYVVDGVPYSGSINAINPADIESTSILKDASATAIYGSRGANGVILINTRKGRSNSSTIDVDIKTGVNLSLLPRYNTIKSPEEYIGLTWESLYNRGVASGEANPTDFANNTLFSAGGIDPKYNLWDVDGANLINPTTRTVNNNISRKYNPENWGDYGFQNSTRTEANLKMSGGNDTTRYFSSFGYLEDIGYLINSDYKRYSTRLNLSHQVKPWLKGSANLGYAFSETNSNGQSSDSGSVFWFVDNIPSIFPLFTRDNKGNFIPEPIFGGNEYDYGIGRSFGALTNSIADAHYNRKRAKKHELNANFSLNAILSDNLTLENTFGSQYYNKKYNSLNNPFYGSGAGQGGAIYKSDTELIVYNLLNLLRYKHSFNDHSIEVLAAHESNRRVQKRFTANMQKMVHPNIDDLNNFVIVSSPPRSWTDKSSLESYFGQINYNFQEKYFLTGSIRRDGSSRFIGDNKWDTFGSIGASWIISKENFMNNSNFFDFLKFKASYGLVGEQAGAGYYPGYTTYNVNNLNDEISISEKIIGNPNLTWETSKQFQTGIEFSLGKYLDATVDYYIKNTSNLFFDRRIGPSVGYALQTVNDGSLQNSGLEFDVTTHVLNKSDYSLDFTINGEFLKNKLTAMPIDPATEEQKVLDISGRYGRSKGHSLYDFYTREWAGVDPTDGTAMWNQYYNDADNNGVLDDGESISSLTEFLHDNPNSNILKTTTKTYSSATQKYIGKSAIPKIRGAFRLAAKIKTFDISTQFLYSLGGYAYDGVYAGLMHNRTAGNNNWHKDINNRWQNPGDITNVPRLSSNQDINVNSSSTRFITKSDFLSLNNVRVGYSIPKAYIDNTALSSLNISLTGDNLFLLSHRDGFNPSTAETGASSTYRYSPLSSVTLGVKAKF